MYILLVLRKSIIFTSLFLAAQLFSTQLAAKDLNDAVEAMRVGDFAEAYCIMRPLAESGDADSQYNIGWMYLNGYGLRVNDSLALEWWEKASEQGHSDASFSIGMLYSLGEGKVPKDLEKAVDYYLTAAEDGHEDAVTMLQYMLMRNDREIRSRLHYIAEKDGHLFGKTLSVKATKLNARNGPSVNDMIVTQLLQGQRVLEIYIDGKWSQVITLDDKTIDRTVWVYNSLLETLEQAEARAESVSSDVIPSETESSY